MSTHSGGFVIIENNMDGVLYGYDKLNLWSYEQEYRLTLLGAGEGYHELPYIKIPEIFIGHAVSKRIAIG